MIGPRLRRAQHLNLYGRPRHERHSRGAGSYIGRLAAEKRLCRDAKRGHPLDFLTDAIYSFDHAPVARGYDKGARASIFHHHADASEQPINQLFRFGVDIV
jgi:hypothetical protein